MATSSRTWFYSTPEPRPYYIEERVNHTLWKHRLQGLFMSCTQANVPIRMEGKWNDIPVMFQWKPGDYFILRSGKEVKELIGVLRQILMLRPALAYEDPDGMHVVEWHTDGGKKRWQDMQGNPQYQGLRRLR
ncbi:MAG: hypothetical protein HXY40_15760 [Chloroflexi bacterium]|nr:hypothetical protein [Chloroflexota bacterium]